MIFNKSISIVLSGLFFIFLALLFSSVSVMFLNGGLLPVVGIFLFVIFYFITKVFYNYLRNDDFYKNNRTRSSDKPGEKYIIKGEKDYKKIFRHHNIYILWSVTLLLYARVPERPKGEDLRSSGIGLRGFESLPLHFLIILLFYDS